jgi:hypothetical protein
MSGIHQLGDGRNDTRPVDVPSADCEDTGAGLDEGKMWNHGEMSRGEHDIASMRPHQCKLEKSSR